MKKEEANQEKVESVVSHSFKEGSPKVKLIASFDGLEPVVLSHTQAKEATIQVSLGSSVIINDESNKRSLKLSLVEDEGDNAKEHINVQLSEIEDTLSRGIAHFAFRKANGKVREAFGTRNVGLIPGEPTEFKGRDKNYTPNPDQVNYYDLESRAWRSFMKDKFIAKFDASHL